LAHDHHLVEIATERSLRGEEHYGVIFVEMHRLRLGESIRRLAPVTRLHSAALTTDALQRPTRVFCHFDVNEGLTGPIL
jgi:hypothetical protein